MSARGALQRCATGSAVSGLAPRRATRHNLGRAVIGAKTPRVVGADPETKQGRIWDLRATPAGPMTLAAPTTLLGPGDTERMPPTRPFTKTDLLL